MLTRSSFKRPQIERTRTVHTPIPEHLRRSASFARADIGIPITDPKPEVHRSQALRDMANGRQCLLQFPDRCLNPSTDTTVAAHSNWADHGKAGARKADDCYMVWGCFACHSLLDQSSHLTDAEKRASFDAAHARQVQEWVRIASDPKEKPRFRKAADWALNLLMGKK
jgi:hypothetical protein